MLKFLIILGQFPVIDAAKHIELLFAYILLLFCLITLFNIYKLIIIVLFVYFFLFCSKYLLFSGGNVQIYILLSNHLFSLLFIANTIFLQSDILIPFFNLLVILINLTILIILFLFKQMKGLAYFLQ